MRQIGLRQPVRADPVAHRKAGLFDGNHQIDANGVDWWGNLIFNGVRYEEMEIGLTVYIG